jgi:hypothetical protein
MSVYLSVCPSVHPAVHCIFSSVIAHGQNPCVRVSVCLSVCLLFGLASLGNSAKRGASVRRPARRLTAFRICFSAAGQADDEALPVRYPTLCRRFRCFTAATQLDGRAGGHALLRVADVGGSRAIAAPQLDGQTGGSVAAGDGDAGCPAGAALPAAAFSADGHLHSEARGIITD